MADGDIILAGDDGESDLLLENIGDDNDIVLDSGGIGGEPGQGVASGGSPGQVLVKDSSMPFSTRWATLTPVDVGAPFLSVKDFGAVGDDVTDDTGAIQSAIDAAFNTSAITAGAILYFPPGIYRISTKLTVDTAVTFMGAGEETSIVHQISTNQDGIYGLDVASVAIQDLMIKGPGSGTGIGINFDWSTAGNIPFLLLSRVFVKQFGSDGIKLNTQIVSRLEGVNSRENGGHGFNMAHAGTSCAFIACWARDNAMAGYRFFETVYSGLTACAADNNGIGYLIESAQSIVFSSCGAEGTLIKDATYNGYGWKIDNSSVINLDGCWITDNRNIGVWVTNGSQAVGINVADNTPNATAVNFIKVDSACNATIYDLHNTTANSLAAGTTSTINDGAGALKPATDIITPNNHGLYGRNAANTANKFLLGVDSGDNTILRSAGVGLYLQTQVGTNIARILDGGTDFDLISHKITNLATPTNTGDAATKGYVDSVTSVGALLAANNLSDLANVTTARTNLGVAIGTNVQAYDATLASLAAYNTNGLLVQTAADTFTGRTITGTTNQVTVTNGNGVSGNPTLSLPQSIHTGASPSFAGLTLTGSVDVTGTASSNIATFRDSGAVARLTIDQSGNTAFSQKIGTGGISVGAISAKALSTSTDTLYLQGNGTYTGNYLNILNSGAVQLMAFSSAAQLALSNSSTGIALFNTSDQTTNFERGLISWASNIFTVQAGKGGTGTARNARFGTNTRVLDISEVAGMSGFYQFGASNPTANTIGTVFSGTYSASSGAQTLVSISPTVTQTSSGAYTMLLINPTESTTGSGAKMLFDAQVGSSSKFSVDNTGNITHADAANIILGTTTGTKIGTSTSQKLSFFNATPVVQPSAATDLGTALSNLGLRASGTAYPVTTSGAVTLTGTTQIQAPQITGASGTLNITAASDGGDYNIFSSNGAQTLAVYGSAGNSLSVNLLDGNLTVTSGLFFPAQAPTVSAPTYVKGGVYFDTTLNKLRIGGASAWETVTSV